MSLKCGLVGLPNVGKSTIFNALTRSNSADVANYPFCTIDPNIGIIEVPDERFDAIVAVENPKKTVPAIIEFVDIAGLVKGASKGEGLGNDFLSHIQNVDAIIHVVRLFSDKNITHVAGEFQPKNDLETIQLELILADLQRVEKRIESNRKKLRSQDKQTQKEQPVLEKIKEHLEKELPIHTLELSEEEKNTVKIFNFLTQKPVMFVCNISESEIANYNTNPLYKEVEAIAQKQNAPIVAISGKIEREIGQFSKEEEKDFLAEYGLEKSNLDVLITKAYELLGYITFFTAGPKEVHAWQIVKNTFAPQAGGKIHTDIERGFIRAEVLSFANWQEYKSFKKAQEFGKLQIEGKDYVIQDGDIVYFRFNV